MTRKYAMDRRVFEYVQAVAPQTTAATLWPTIVARTDQIYATIEDLLAVFETVMRALVASVGMAPNDLEIAPALKDPVRLHEKALDDYVHDFEDWDDARVIPETCVIDLVRG
eukprot:2454511-Prymnesium_polylepis.1